VLPAPAISDERPGPSGPGFLSSQDPAFENRESNPAISTAPPWRYATRGLFTSHALPIGFRVTGKPEIIVKALTRTFRTSRSSMMKLQHGSWEASTLKRCSGWPVGVRFLRIA